MIGVGINPNVYLSKIGKSDKGALELYFSEGTAEIANNPFDQLNDQSGEIVDNSLDTKLMLFPPMVPKKEDQTEAKKRELVSMDITDLRNQLTHIAQQYMTTDKIKFDMFRNTGIKTAADYDENILDATMLNKIANNLFDQFIELMQPYVGDATKRFRLKLQRQSKDKHFATLPKKFLKDNPFLEPIEVPEASSKVKFTKWEKEQGLDSAEVAKKDEADKPAEGAAPTDPSAVFGNR